MQTKLDFLIERVQNKTRRRISRRFARHTNVRPRHMRDRSAATVSRISFIRSLSLRSLWRWVWIRIPSVQRCCMTASRTPSLATRRSKTNSARRSRAGGRRNPTGHAALLQGAGAVRGPAQDVPRHGEGYPRYPHQAGRPTGTMRVPSSSCLSASSATGTGDDGDLRADRAPSRHEPHQVGA